jgi:hypothetical protein
VKGGLWDCVSESESVTQLPVSLCLLLREDKTC